MNTLDPIERQALTTAQTWLASTSGARTDLPGPTHPTAPTPPPPHGEQRAPTAGAAGAHAPLPDSAEEMADLIRQAAAIPPDVIRTALLLEEIGRLAAAELTWVATAPDALRPQAISLIVEHLSARTPHPPEHLRLIVNALTGEAGTLRQIISAENRA